MQDLDDTATRLKAFRSNRSLSQRKLALRAGVANATISQIEAGTLNPTIGALKKILFAMNVTLSEFFADDDPAGDTKIFYSAHELRQMSERGVTYLQVGGDLSSKAIQLMSERYNPGATTGRHLLKHDGEECGIILKGYLTVTVGDQSQTLGPGDAYYFRSDQPHSFKNEGETICELVSACSPPTF